MLTLKKRHYACCLLGITIFFFTTNLLIVDVIGAARVPVHNQEWTDYNESDPGLADSVSEDLQKIVVLCATRPKSPAFDRAWANYLIRHKVTAVEIDPLIAEVLRQAEDLNKKKGSGRIPKEITRERMKRVSERLRHKDR